MGEQRLVSRGDRRELVRRTIREQSFRVKCRGKFEYWGNGSLHGSTGSVSTSSV